MQSLQRILSLQLANAAREVLGKCLCAKKPWISQATLASIDQCRQAIRRGDVEEYRRLAAGPKMSNICHCTNGRIEAPRSSAEGAEGGG